jgi:hypothetical protein
MADGIYASMHAMKPPRGDPPGHAALVDPRSSKLLERQNPVLPRGDSRNRDLGWGVFFSHTENKSPHPLLLPSRRREAGAANLIR